jgi:D-tyrosyl-tRNA(Tyr) deacylase
MGRNSSLLLVVSEADPVARAVAARWGALAATGDHVDGVPVRELPTGALVLHRPSLHIHDELLDRRLPANLRGPGRVLVFPSIHRSESQIACLTVHPLGNPGAEAEVGGRPRSLVPADAPRMADALRRLAERKSEVGLSTTYEATHHGPELELPAFFVEIGYGDLPGPPDAAVRALAETLPLLEPSVGDRVALAVGGGHYAPHFTDLTLRRGWAFGHILSRHALASIDGPTARRAYSATLGAEGVVAARVEDLGLPALEGVGPRLRDRDAPPRGAAPTADASGT